MDLKAIIKNFTLKEKVTLYAREITRDIVYRMKLDKDSRQKVFKKYFTYKDGKPVWRLYISKYEKAMEQLNNDIVKENLDADAAKLRKKTYIDAIRLVVNTDFRIFGLIKSNEFISLSKYDISPDRFVYSTGYAQLDYEENIAQERIAQAKLYHSMCHKERASVFETLPVYDPDLFACASELIRNILDKRLFMILGCENLIGLLKKCEVNYKLNVSNINEVNALRTLINKVKTLLNNEDIVKFIKEHNDVDVYCNNTKTFSDYIDTYSRLVHTFLEIPSNEGITERDMRFAYLKSDNVMDSLIRNPIVDIVELEENSDNEDIDILDPVI